MLTWSISDSFGGMTSAFMHRSRAFVREAARSVDVLTLDDRLDYVELEAKLRGAGVLVDGIRLFNIWDWLRTHEDAPRKAAPRHAHTPISVDVDVREHRRGDVVLLREQLSDDGRTILQTDRFREDGTLLVTDRRNSETGKRSVVLYDSAGSPARSWGSVWGIYRYWLDQIIGSQESFLVVDSKTAARFMHTYRRRNVVTMHVMHGSHRSADGETLSTSRRSVLEHLNDFDSVVLLTDGQRADLIRDLGPQDNVAVIPNGFDGAASSTGAIIRPVHTRGAGVMLASLIRRKRVSHAVKAVAKASRAFDVTLDVFGEGARRALLEKTIRSLDVGTRVHLRGHDTAARSAFATADFMVLTSTSEGLPLALVEGMDAGCIPIAYDIPYGPSDLITNGRNGFLVPAGDIDALAERIVELQRMPARSLAAMRRRAQKTARRFDDRIVTRTWAREMEKAVERKRSATTGRPESALLRLRRKAGRAKRRLTRLVGRYDRSV